MIEFLDKTGHNFVATKRSPGRPAFGSLTVPGVVRGGRFHRMTIPVTSRPEERWGAERPTHGGRELNKL